MKKLLSLALVLTMVLTFTVPAMAAASADFINGTVATIDKNGYNCFGGTEITSNNSATQFDNFRFIADNKTLNAWYVDVTDDISGTLEVAYKVGSAYYVVTFDIDGPGKYFVADSRGSAGVNMVKIGAFAGKEGPEPHYGLFRFGSMYSNSSHSMAMDEFDALIDDLNADGLLKLDLTNGWGPITGYGSEDEVYVELYNGQLVDFEVAEPIYVFEYKGDMYLYKIEQGSFSLGRQDISGEWGQFAEGGLVGTHGVSFVVDENSIDYELIVIAEIIKLPAKPVAYDLELGKSSLTIENGGFISINDYDPQITYSVRVSGGDFVGLDCEEDEFYIDSFGYLKTKYRNPCFSYAWDGGSKLTISFYRVR